jgi:luciferase family oxidoreductase group 1
VHLQTPFSILDRANILAGQPESETLHAAIARAKNAERLGYHRFWVAEHHGVPGIAGSAPAVMVAAIAAATERIRVGSGGVMLPNHQPLVVAEQFSTLEALHPGRIDLGLGRSVGFTSAVRAALRQDKDAAERFEQELCELIAFLHGEAAITARPRNHAATPLFVMATGAGVDIAARLGLPVVLGGPALVGRPEEQRNPALNRYRQAFQPSAMCAEPYVVAAVNVMVADTEHEARDLLLPEAWAMAHARTMGDFPPLQPVTAIKGRRLTERQQSLVERNVESSVYGTRDTVAETLQALVERTGAAELLVTGATYDRSAQSESDAALAEALAREL